MQTIFYPGYDRQPCQAFYGIANHRDRKMADIVVINSPRLGPATSLLNTQEGRDRVLNRILANELPGVSPQYVRFFVLIDSAVADRMHGIELPIQPQSFVSSRNGVRGCADFRSDFEQRRLLLAEEMNKLCTAVGYQRESEGFPPWVTKLFSESSHPV